MKALKLKIGKNNQEIKVGAETEEELKEFITKLWITYRLAITNVEIIRELEKPKLEELMQDMLYIGKTLDIIMEEKN